MGVSETNTGWGGRTVHISALMTKRDLSMATSAQLLLKPKVAGPRKNTCRRQARSGFSKRLGLLLRVCVNNHRQFALLFVHSLNAVRHPRRQVEIIRSFARDYRPRRHLGASKLAFEVDKK